MDGPRSGAEKKRNSSINTPRDESGKERVMCATRIQLGVTTVPASEASQDFRCKPEDERKGRLRGW